MPKDTATRLRQLRRAKDVTQDEVAAAVDVDRSMISKMEAGKGGGRELIVKLADYYAVSLDWLLTGQGRPDPPSSEDLSEIERRLLMAFRNAPAEAGEIYLQMLLAVGKDR